MDAQGVEMSVGQKGKTNMKPIMVLALLGLAACAESKPQGLAGQDYLMACRPQAHVLLCILHPADASNDGDTNDDN